MIKVVHKKNLDKKVFFLSPVRLGIRLLVLSLFSFSGVVWAQRSDKRDLPSASGSEDSDEKGPISFPESSDELERAMILMRAGRYRTAALRLYSLEQRRDYRQDRMQIKYSLGLALMGLDLNQMAAFQFVEVIRRGNNRYVTSAIEKLFSVADRLGDDDLLNYAIVKAKTEDLPEKVRSLISFHFGEAHLKEGFHSEAITFFDQVPRKSSYFFQARMSRSVALLEEGKVQEAISGFKSMVEYLSASPVTDTNKVIATVGLARAYYQAEDWDKALAAYREIPRDHPLWHEGLFESSWAMVRAAKFRSALSNFQSLHSSYYQDYFIPESFLLRAIVYLYVCKYDEFDKVLQLFEKNYDPVRSSIDSFLLKESDPLKYYKIVEAAYNYQVGQPSVGVLPAKVGHKILREGDVKRSFSYLKILRDEKKKLESLSEIAKTPLGESGRRIFRIRSKNVKIRLGRMTKEHLIEMQSELRDFYDQIGFIRYERINSEKEGLKKQIANQGGSKKLANDSVDRSVYVQNGYEYWPFIGENWIDEIGNYHYLGKQSCE